MKLNSDSCPIQQHIPNEIPFSEDQSKIVDSEIELLLLKGAIEPSQFISRIFIVPKSNGKFRPVINPSFLNYYVTYEHFKQETFTVVLDLIQKNDYFTSIDLKDAYFRIFIKEDFQKYLKFYWRGSYINSSRPLWPLLPAWPLYEAPEANIFLVSTTRNQRTIGPVSLN